MLQMSDHVQRRGNQVVVHSVAWAVIFILPFLGALITGNLPTANQYLNFVIVPIVMIALFYLNYCIYVDRWLFNRKVWKYVLVNLATIVVVMVATELWHRCFHPVDVPHHDPERPARIGFYVSQLVSMLMIVLLSIAIKTTGRWYRSQAALQALERERSEAELKNLKSQLNPHFLFNTLNNIYVLTAIDPTKAQYAIHSLSGLLRYVLDQNSGDSIALSKELDFTRSYIDLMKLRLSEEQTDLSVNIDAGNESYRIAPLTFISLIENAFKHGISPTEHSFIDIDIKVVAGLLVCRISNSNFPKQTTDRSGSGIGLDNLKRRLELLYKGEYTFDVSSDAKTYTTLLTINLSQNGNPHLGC